MKSGFAYANVPIYRLVMRLLYGREYHRKYQAVADLIPSSSSVVDLCAGDCLLAYQLANQSSRYLGLELNPRFVNWARRAGINARIFDLRTEEIPVADVVCIQSSLYQFIPEDAQIVQRMIDSARQLVIVSEPVVNLASSRNSLVSRIAARATAVDGRAFHRRHTFETLSATLIRVAADANLVERQSRDAIFLIRKARHTLRCHDH
jgi:hypothetical protein